MNKKQIRLTESDLKQIVKESVNRIVKESDELDANDWKARYLRDAHYPIDMKDIENKASWETFDDNVNSLYGQRGCYNDDYASQAYADDPFSDFYGLENKNTYDLKGYLAKRKLNKLAKNESKNMNKKLIRLTESDLHKIVKESVNRVLNEIGDTPRGQNMLGRVAGRGRERAADYARANGVTGEQTPFRVGKIKKHDNIANDALKTSAKAKGQSIDNGNWLWMHDDNFAKGFYGQEDAESAIYDPTLTSYYERGNIEALSDEDLIDSYYGAAYGGTPIDLDLLYREIKARGLGKALKQDPRYHKYH